MIITVTLNPAVDKTIIVRDIVLGSLNRVCGVSRYPGGKGNNVARIVCQMGGRCLATGFLPGNSGRIIEDMMRRDGIPTNFVYTCGETRTNTKLIDETTRICTELNEPGPDATEEDLCKLEDKLREIVRTGDIVVFSGSVPGGLADDTYRRLILLSKNLGVDTILDADGVYLREGVEAAPTAVKPNLPEFLRLFDLTSDAPEQIESSVSALLSKDIKRILVSLGPDGARLISENGVLFAPAMDVPVVSTVGAGDAMTAALALSMEKGEDDGECLRRACAYAAATVMSEHFERVEEETVTDLLPQVNISLLI